MTAKSAAEFIDRCWGYTPDVDLLEIDAYRSAKEGAVTDLRQMLPAVRLTGLWSGRKRECEIGNLLAVGPDGVASFRHGGATLLLQLHPGDTHKESQGEGRSLQGPSEPLPILERARVSTQAPRQVDIQAHVGAGCAGPQIAERVGVSYETIKNQSVACQRSNLDRTYALVSQSMQRPPSA